MGSPRHSLRTVGRGGSARGLVLVELMLFLLVVVLAVILVLVALGRVRHTARLKELGADLQTFASIFESRRSEDGGRWPQTPEEAGSRLMDATWDAGSPFGGEYGWVPPTASRPGLITLTAFAPNFPLQLTPADLLAVDRAIDDGDLKAGRFRTGFNGWPVYQVTEKP